LKCILAIILTFVFVCAGVAIAVPVNENRHDMTGTDFIRGLHFGGYWPVVDTRLPGTVTVQVWKDNSTPPTVHDLSAWVQNANANCMVFTPYYATMYGALGGTTNNSKPADDYIEQLAESFAKNNSKLILMFLPTASSYGMFNSSMSDTLTHAAIISLKHPNIIIELDEPDWGGGTSVPEMTFKSWVDAVKNTNPDCMVTVGLDYPRGTPAKDNKWWKYCDGVMLIDYWVSDAITLGNHIQTWVTALAPLPVWTFLPTGDLWESPVYITTVTTMDFLDVAIAECNGSFIFDRGGMWTFAGYNNSYDNGERYEGIMNRYTALLVPEYSSALAPIAGTAVITLIVIWSSSRSRHRKP
jgi:hypothetical protein